MDTYNLANTLNILSLYSGDSAQWSGFQMVSTKAIAIAKAEPFENQSIWSPTFKKPWFQIIPDFRIQIPTVLD